MENASRTGAAEDGWRNELTASRHRARQTSGQDAAKRAIDRPAPVALAAAGDELRDEITSTTSS
jgi:hypothetical protein